MYIKQIANTLRTFGECFLNTHEIGGETLRQFPTSTTKWGANTPPSVGADSSCPYPDIANYTYSHYQIWHSYHRIHILLILKSMSSFHCMHVSHNHIYISYSPNPYIFITTHAFPHYQIRVYSLSNMHIHIINYVFSSHHAHIFALPYQYIRFLLSIILNIKQPNMAYIYT